MSDVSDIPGVPDVPDWEGLYRHAPCGLFTSDADGVITRVSTTLLDWLGAAEHDVVGHSFRDFLDTGSQLFYETRYLPALRLRGEVKEVSLTLASADGGRVPALVNSVLSLGTDGGPAQISSAVFDVSERQNYERDLLASRRSAEASEGRLRLLRDSATAFAASAEEDDVAAALATAARASYLSRFVAVYLADETGALRLAAGESPIDAGLDHDEHRPQWRAFTSGERVGLSAAAKNDAGRNDAAKNDAAKNDAAKNDAAKNDAAKNDEAKHDEGADAAGRALRDARLSELVALPLTDESGPIGALVCFFARERSLTEADDEVLSAIMRQAATVLARVRLQRELARLALHDQLTGLGNRVLLEIRMAEALADAYRERRALALIVLDLDGFKAINDRFGHASGDAVLVRIAERLRSSVRAQDVIGRFGGDEFVIICTDADEVAAEVVAKRVSAAIQEVADDEVHLAVTASVGVAVYPAGTLVPATGDEIFSAADAAMYLSKSLGKNRVTVARV
jgi:diguanylate cyclase (GGDEF)-like protein/PAS domain S-box-containing protein